MPISPNHCLVLICRLRGWCLILAAWWCGLLGVLGTSAHALDVPLAIEPAYLRVDLKGGTVTTAEFLLRVHESTTVIAAESDCRCLALQTPLPAVATPAAPLVLRARIFGAATSVEHLTLRTTRGTVTAAVQVVTDGLGKGIDILKALTDLARRETWTPWIIVHDLNGAIRNCGCSTGSLGGIDHLAVLPAAFKGIPGARFILTGDVDGAYPGVGAALAAQGWTIQDPAVRVAADPSLLIGDPEVVAIVATGTCAINHMRIVRPVASGGMVAQVLLLDARLAIRQQIVLPIDPTLPAESAILAAFPAPRTITLSNYTQELDCVKCHAASVAIWQKTRHARALDSLKENDRTDDCMVCHTTAEESPTVRVPGVTCIACHGNSSAHILAEGRVATTLIDCRSCHNAQHHPTFNREAGWKVIEHREPELIKR